VTGPSVLERLVEAKRTGDYGALLAAIPYAQFLGISVALVNDELITTMRYDHKLIGNPAIPALHGGTLCALLESAAIFESLWRGEPGVLPKTITFTVEYLRSAAALDTHARATITRQGRRVASVRVEAWQADRASTVATAHAALLVTS
jgi:uncharacterized protein (TIGR00369 family)